ncbi:MAG: TolC family protein [Bacteroidia bacterium]|nr:TolC family protein [Bacteroidia bacterium]
MQTKIFSNITAAVVALTIAGQLQLSAQNQKTLKLEDVINMALQNNHLLNVRKFQVDEKQQKVNEDRIKYLPTIGIGGSYQYNTNLPSITVEEGKFGALMTYPLPPTDEIIEVGKHNVYNAGVTIYQPLTQIGKINAGVRYSKTELQIARTEEVKAGFQVKQGVEKLYFGLLILKKQIEEAELKVTLAKIKLHDVESAVAAGKTTESNKYGLSASEADEEQNLLKLKIQYDDYSDDLKHLTGLDQAEPLVLEAVPAENFIENLSAIDTSLYQASLNNNDLKIASLYKTKADYSIRASKFTYLPDLGILGGYTYQEGIDIYPKNNTFIGASLKWNLQDILTTRTIQRQRIYLKKQAEENLANTKEQVNNDIAKAYRKLKQAEELINVAGKVVEYRREDLKIQNDRRNSGLNLESDLLTAKAAMAKSESDYFAAQLNYRIALSELKILTGSY